MSEGLASVAAVSASDLPTSTPSAEGVAAAGVLAFLDDLETAAGVEPHGLLVLRHGRVVVAGWWAPYTSARRHLLYSLSKTFTATAAGLAVADGLLDLDETVIGCFPELDAQVTDPRSRSMLVRHLVTMSTGHLSDMWEPVMHAGGEEPVAAFLALAPERDPGTVFAYNQPATYTLAAIVQRRTGRTLVEQLRPRLLDPLGIGPVAWQQHPAGRDLGFSGLHASTGAVARLGQLYLQGGRWQGRQLLPEAWVEQASRPHVPTPEQDGPDWQQGYGFQLWMSQHGYRGDGAYGQFCLVLPEQDAVVAITGGSPDMQRVLDGVWRHLLPALDDAAGASADDDVHLAVRLAALSLPGLPGVRGPQAPQRWRGAVLAPAAGVRRDQPSLRSVRVEHDDDGWSVVLQDGGEPTRARLGQEAWTTTGTGVPMAVSGGWLADGTLRLALVLLETPHRLLLTCRLTDGDSNSNDSNDDGTFEARWATEPLHGGPLHTMRAPG